MGKTSGGTTRKGLDMKYKNRDLDIGKEGPCLVAGHPKEHKLLLNPCWSTMRSYLFDHTFEQYLKAVKDK